MFVLTNHLLEYTTTPSILLVRHYVYEWWDRSHCFYVGSGTNRRAWNTHNLEAETRKLQCRFRVVITHHNLTKAMAHTEERYRIKLRRSQGHTLLQRNSQC